MTRGTLALVAVAGVLGFAAAEVAAQVSVPKASLPGTGVTTVTRVTTSISQVSSTVSQVVSTVDQALSPVSQVTSTVTNQVSKVTSPVNQVTSTASEQAGNVASQVGHTVGESSQPVSQASGIQVPNVSGQTSKITKHGSEVASQIGKAVSRSGIGASSNGDAVSATTSAVGRGKGLATSAARAVREAKRARTMVRGGPGNDRLTGTPGDDLICGGDGNDLLRALHGDDDVFGGRGRDRILGGPGRDRVYGGGGRDVLLGGPGADSFFARDGKPDRVSGGKGRDVAYVDPRLDRVTGVERIRFLARDRCTLALVATLSSRPGERLAARALLDSPANPLGEASTAGARAGDEVVSAARSDRPRTSEPDNRGFRLPFSGIPGSPWYLFGLGALLLILAWLTMLALGVREAVGRPRSPLGRIRRRS